MNKYIVRHFNVYDTNDNDWPFQATLHVYREKYGHEMVRYVDIDELLPLRDNTPGDMVEQAETIAIEW